MAENNKSYRIRTKVGAEADSFLNVQLEQDYDSLEILSLKISDKDVYKLHNSDYGVVVGRVIANGNFGVPNAKISVFIPSDGDETNLERWNLYPYTTTRTKNENTDIRYNLLPDESTKDCHVAVGTFPNKTYLLENDALLEVFDEYYKYTTRTNAAGDYLICGVPTGMQTLHMDLDLSDCGILSQRPRDFVYKGYTIEQFENPNQFKKDENIDGLSQIFTQDLPVYVHPFWGNEENGEEIGITRADFEIPFKFETTCVFMGSAISDNASNGVGKKCVPSNQMGAMDELTAGEGTIEMIRKTPGGNVEEFSIRGNQLIDGNGVWCYQIPMNLDYMMTDEYGNMVPTDDPEKGLPTRARVRFRVSLTDMENGSRSYYRAKYLVPNNPAIEDEKVDYNFGTYTDESSYRDLFWNGVYTVKSYIPRFQKSKRWKSERFSGIKGCNYYGGNNPMPYNNLRIRLPFMFTVLCIFVKLFIKIVALVNRLQAALLRIRRAEWVKKRGVQCTFIGDGLCPDMEGWYFAPSCAKGLTNKNKRNNLFGNTFLAIIGKGEITLENDPLTDIAEQGAGDKMMATEYLDETSVDYQNTPTDEEKSVCLTTDIDYLLNCFEMNLAQEYRVIKFDFYNDWVNGVLYFPRWMRKVKRKKKYKFSLSNGIRTYFKDRVQGCMNSETSNVKVSRYYTQQCSLSYSGAANTPWTGITTSPNCDAKYQGGIPTTSRCHKKAGLQQSDVFGKKSGLVTEETTMLGQYVYYLKPCEWKDTNEETKARTLLFATDIVLLGTLNECDENGIPQAFKYLSNSSYIMPTNLALTTMDDDAYIYSNDDGTICATGLDVNGNSFRGGAIISYNTDATSNRHTTQPAKATQTPEETLQKSVKLITPNYQSTYKAYEKSDDKLEYKNNDDPIPVTEAAGIMWNYSGPGQGDVKKLGKIESPEDYIDYIKSIILKNKGLYTPGGHFLGLSCVNSETNIKSCVNLKRICELGASMSQRREEVRGYNEEGKPEYRYYVPTGLISNVDIESAAFRSMFATLNHNKLIAIERNEATGYKKYNFRYLRLDGFDGSLSQYVHQEGSPYNESVNNDEHPEAITDSSKFFKEVFGDAWEKPENFDENETKYTERRTVERTINDYYIFRLGLNSLDDAEQRKHFLIHNKNSHSMPQYENSLYFYFGLKDGATALDEFKKQFFSECEKNTVMKEPSLGIEQEVDTALTCTAALIINNMVPAYTITLKDNTEDKECAEYVTNKDKVELNDICGDVKMVIGHEYTVTVTDSLDRTIVKTFIFAPGSIKIQARTVNFRVPGTGVTNDPKKGGFVKINDKVTIFGEEHSASEFTFSYKSGAETGSLTLASSYTDITGEKWNLYYLPKTGNYEILLSTGGQEVSVYSTTLEDNLRINLYVACDYLSYKQAIDANTGEEMLYSKVLSGISYSDWTGNTGVFEGATWQDWLMRHSYYRQTPDDNESYDHFIYTKGNNNVAIFGQPEKGGLTASGEVFNNGTVYKGDYNLYQGFSLDEGYSFIPTLYWDTTSHEETTAGTVFRNTIDAMSYSEDGRAAADASEVTITSYSAANGTVTLGFNGSLENGHGAIVVLENGAILFGVVNGNQITINGGDPYNGQAPSQEILSLSTVYPTLCVPSMYKPFYGDVTVALWNVQTIVLKDEMGGSVPEKENLPTSYKAQGTIYNGLTFYQNRFDPGIPADSTKKSFATYMILEDVPDFWSCLTADTATDNIAKKEHEFGIDNMESGFCREVTTFKPKIGDPYEDFDVVSYAVCESAPTMTIEPEKNTVLTRKYANGFDKIILTDSCDISDVFFKDLRIKVFDANRGTSGDWCLYTTEPIPENTKIYKTTEPLFDKSEEPITVYDSDALNTCCLGTYNQFSPRDTKGSKTTVISSVTVTQTSASFSFKFSETQTTGVKIMKEAPNETALYRSGVTLLHSYTLKDQYKENIDILESLTSDDSNLMKVRTPQNNTSNYTVVSSTATTAFIAKYEKQEEGSKNKLTIYKLYPFESLDVMYPANQGGIEPYMIIPGSYMEDSHIIYCSMYAQDITIPISTNVRFSVTNTNNVSWIQVTAWSTAKTREYSAGVESFTVRISNKNTTSSDREGLLTIHCIEDGVTLKDIRVTIHQLHDDITPQINAINNKINDINSDINIINDKIDELSGNT